MSTPAPFAYKHRVAFHETDAAGIVHFSNFFRMAEEAETHAMASAGFSLDSYAYPRVHVEADYRAPLRFWDECEILVSLEKIGTGSLHWVFSFYTQGTCCATIRCISARRDKADYAPAPFSDAEKARLRPLVFHSNPSEK